MSELPPANPNRGASEYEWTTEEAKRFEARQLAALNEVLWLTFYGKIDGKGCADEALDEVANVAESLGQRDPEMARILIEELESGPHAEMEQTISDRLRARLGLPPWDRNASLPPEASSPPAEHGQ